MRVGNAQRIRQHGALLIRAKAKRILKAACFDGLGQIFEMFAAANHEENDAGLIAQPFCGAQHRLEVMSTA